MTELISSIVQLVLVIAQTWYYKAKLAQEKKIQYEKDIKKQVQICLSAIINLQDNAKKDYDMSVDDEQDDDLKPKGKI